MWELCSGSRRGHLLVRDPLVILVQLALYIYGNEWNNGNWDAVVATEDGKKAVL